MLGVVRWGVPRFMKCIWCIIGIWYGGIWYGTSLVYMVWYIVGLWYGGIWYGTSLVYGMVYCWYMI